MHTSGAQQEKLPNIVVVINWITVELYVKIPKGGGFTWIYYTYSFVNEYWVLYFISIVPHFSRSQSDMNIFETNFLRKASLMHALGTESPSSSRTSHFLPCIQVGIEVNKSFWLEKRSVLRGAIWRWTFKLAEACSSYSVRRTPNQSWTWKILKFKRIITK